jgi:hypothetical protein
MYPVIAGPMTPSISRTTARLSAMAPGGVAIRMNNIASPAPKARLPADFQFRRIGFSLGNECMGPPPLQANVRRAPAPIL